MPSVESIERGEHRISSQPGYRSEPKGAAESYDSSNIDQDCPHPSSKSRVLIAALPFPFTPPSVFRLAVGVRLRSARVLIAGRSRADGVGNSDIHDVDHDRDRACAMSWESVVSGAFQNQLPIAAGISAKHATNIHISGRSMVRIIPTIATVATHAANTRSFR